MHRLLRFTAVPVLGCSLLLAAAAPVSASSNVVYVGSKASAQVTKDSPVVLSMSVPAGVWWATITASVDGSAGVTAGDGSTICFLARDADARDQVSWTLNAGQSGDSEESLFLTALIPAGDTWSFELHCVTTSTATVRLTNIRMTAVKGSGDGSEKPVFASATNDAGPINGDGQYHFVDAVPVTKGKWWIVAKTDISNNSLHDSDVTCRLHVTDADEDETAVSLAASATGSVGEIAVETAHSFTAPGSVMLECKSSQAFIASNSQAIAIKGGKLQLGVFGGSATTFGTKSPKIYSRYTYSTLNIPTGTTLATIATMNLPAGKWLVQAKAQLNDGANVAVHCSLVAGGVATDAHSYGAGGSGLTGIYLQTSGHSSGTMTIKLKCAAQGSASLSFVRLTAISASAINAVTLN
jgi:hypothetical protein